MQSNAYTRAAARAHTLAGSSFPSDGSEWFANLVYLIKQHDGLSILLSISCLNPPQTYTSQCVNLAGLKAADIQAARRHARACGDLAVLRQSEGANRAA